MRRRTWLAALPVCLLSCGSYGEFQLPPAESAPNLALEWRPAPGPQIARGAALDVLNPSVVRWQDGYLNLYSRFDGTTWSTVIAASRDGFSWQAGEPILQPTLPWEGRYIAANGAAIVFAGEIFYFYQAGEKGQNVLGLARTRDGKRWDKHPTPVLTRGYWMSWDEVSIGDPYVIEVGGQLYLYYLGEDRARRQRLGVARSADGIHWTKLRGNPVLELGGAGDFDENGLGEPAVFPSNGGWMMLYTGRDRAERRALGYATAKDGVHWTKLPQPVLRGGESWNREVVCDATVLVEGGKARIWFGGGDVAKPDERLNGQIGYAELLPR